MIKSKLLSVGLILSSILLSACSSSSPLQQHYYVLSADSQANLTMLSGEPQVSVRRVKLPDYLNQRGIARKISADKIRVSNNLLWAEQLTKSLPGVLARNMAAELQAPVETHPLPAGISVNTIVEVDIERFIGDDKILYLLASYRLVKPKKLETYQYAAEVPLQDGTTDALVNGYNKAVKKLAVDIVRHLQ